MDNYKLLLAYDGSDFYGWQKTRMGLGVEEALQRVLEQVLQQPIRLQAASRTDRGVHALGQVVNFFSKKKPNLISLNRLLPTTLVVRSIEEAPLDFHPTLDVISKEYRYEICYGSIQLPQFRRHSWFVPASLDSEKMRQAANLLTGSHDFSAFCLNRKKQEYSNCSRTLHKISIEEIGDKRLAITIVGNSFFYKMVRCLVGTLVAVGRSKISLSEIEQLLKEKNRSLAGVTGPSHGLTLVKVDYTQTI